MATKTWIWNEEGLCRCWKQTSQLFSECGMRDSFSSSILFAVNVKCNDDDETNEGRKNKKIKREKQRISLIDTHSAKPQTKINAWGQAMKVQKVVLIWLRVKGPHSRWPFNAVQLSQRRCPCAKRRARVNRQGRQRWKHLRKSTTQPLRRRKLQDDGLLLS